MTAELELRWSGGTLDLMGWNTSDSGDFEIRALRNGTDWGNPESVRRTLRSALLDGSVSVKERDDNRTIPLKLRVSAADGTSLAGGEAALALMDGRRCELAWTPPDDFAPTAVFVVVSATLRHEMNDLEELSKRRYYTLTLECLPHALSDASVTIEAQTALATPTLVDDCSSLTGWTATNATLSLSSDITVDAVDATLPFTMTRTGVVDLTTEPYLAFKLYEWYSGSSDFDLEVLSGGSWAEVPFEGRDALAVVFDASGLGAVDGLRLTWQATGATRRVLRNINKQSTPQSPSGWQISTLDVPGSARTPASLLVESPTTGLGTVLLYSGPPYIPDVSGGAIEPRFPGGGAVKMSGAMSILAHGDTRSFDRSAVDIFEGDHSVWVRAAVDDAAPYTSTGVLTLTLKLLDTAGAEVSSEVVGSVRLNRGSATMPYTLDLLGSATLPPASLPLGSNARIRFSLSYVYDGTDPAPEFQSLELDTLLIFNRSLGELTIAEVGAYKKLWLDSASLESGQPLALVGDGEKVDAVPLNLVSQLPSWPGAHVIEPPTTYIYVGTTGPDVTTGTDDAQVSGTFRPAWHTHPAS